MAHRVCDDARNDGGRAHLMIEGLLCESAAALMYMHLA